MLYAEAITYGTLNLMLVRVTGNKASKSSIPLYGASCKLPGLTAQSALV